VATLDLGFRLARAALAFSDDVANDAPVADVAVLDREKTTESASARQAAVVSRSAG
jgi:hypothetical protein